ncbi:MAG: DUF488 domain-containing protein [Planctomycetaceae bacterium]|nr:DUF488 domain-containing protein [Planctomycetaceae bacterium]
MGKKRLTKTIWTIGHSTLSLEEFLERVSDIDLIADVRRFPRSTRHPHFNGDALAAVKEYRWFEGLGGRRSGGGERHPAWRVPAFRAYAAYMETEPFRRALAELEAVAGKQRTAILCAEALWWRCHRRLLSDALVARGWTVLHLPRGEAHRLSPMARVDRNGMLIYDVEENSR